MREHELHTAAAQYLDLALPPAAIHAAIDHAGKASAVTGARLKARGGRKGFPDHIILHGGVARFIEFKAMKGRLSHEQIAMHARLRAAGFDVWLVRSLAELQLQLELAGFPSRVRIAA